MATTGASHPRFVNPGRVIPLSSSRAGGAGGGWGALTATAWRALADDDSQCVIPSIDWIARQASGQPGSPSHELAFDRYLALWSAVLDLLKYSFGWRSPAHGVARWVEAGLPVDDQRLALVAHMLGDDPRDRAVNLAAFLFRQGGWALTEIGHGGLKATFGSSAEYPSLAVPEWVDSEYRARGCEDAYRGSEESPEYLPCRSGGYDCLHLSGHCWDPIARTAARQEAPIRGFSSEPDLAARFHHSTDGEHGTAVLLTQRYAGWFDELVDHGDSLPALRSGRSWRVDVVCTPIGWLGTFRKSRQTGLWFSGPHSLHIWGEWA